MKIISALCLVVAVAMPFGCETDKTLTTVAEINQRNPPGVADNTVEPYGAAYAVEPAGETAAGVKMRMDTSKGVVEFDSSPKEVGREETADVDGGDVDTDREEKLIED